jgi:SAM-dependent methyltransferase
MRRKGHWARPHKTGHMTNTTPDNPFGLDTEPVSSCDLCGTNDFRKIADASPLRCDIVMCNHCCLLFAAPRVAVGSLETFYRNAFTGDAGANIRLSEDGEISPQKVRSEENVAARWSMPRVARHIDLKGKTVLDIRTRTGALAERMIDAGATVTGLDFLEGNVSYARNKRKIPSIEYCSIADMNQLRGIRDEHFDAVTALTIHTLGHLPSPLTFLRNAFRVLKPGGFVFVDEKDVYLPGKGMGKSVFDSGAVHYFHFSRRSLELYFLTAGFSIIECIPDPGRVSSLHHVLTIAQKPLSGSPANAPDLTCEPAMHYKAIRAAEAKQRRIRHLNKIKRARKRVKRFITSLPSGGINAARK